MAWEIWTSSLGFPGVDREAFSPSRKGEADSERAQSEHIVALGFLSAGNTSAADGPQTGEPKQTRLDAERHAWAKLKETRRAIREFPKRRD